MKCHARRVLESGLERREAILEFSKVRHIVDSAGVEAGLGSLRRMALEVEQPAGGCDIAARTDHVFASPETQRTGCAQNGEAMCGAGNAAGIRRHRAPSAFVCWLERNPSNEKSLVHCPAGLADDWRSQHDACNAPNTGARTADRRTAVCNRRSSVCETTDAKKNETAGARLGIRGRHRIGSYLR